MASTTGALTCLMREPRCTSAAKCRRPWFRAALEAAYAPNPSSKARKLVVEPESEEVKTMVRIWIGGYDCNTAGEGEERASKCCAVMSGPIVLVCSW